MKIDFDIIGKRIRYVWFWLLRKDILIFLLFVGLVTGFWWGRTMSSPRDVTIAIPVTYSGIDQQVVFNQALPQILDVTIRDNGKQLRQIKNNAHVLDYDLRAYVSNKEGQIILTAENMRQKLQDLLPGSTKIQKITPEHFTTTYYRQEQKRVPVVVQSHIDLAPQNQLVCAPVVIPDTLVLFGSKEILDSITYIQTQPLYINQLRDSVTVQVPLQIPRGVRVSHQQVKILYLAEQFTEKSFTLPIQVKNAPADIQVRLFPQTVNVVARVGVSHFSQVQASDIEAYCLFPEAYSEALEVRIHTQNPHITNLRISPEKVEYMINQ